MPGYQQLRFMPHPTELYHNEPIYGQVKQKKKPKKQQQQLQQQQQQQQQLHPHYEDIKVRNIRDRKDYERMVMARGDFNPYKFDSLKLMGSCNDVSYLDNFMSMPRQRPVQDMGTRNRSKGISKSSSTVFAKGQKEHRHSIQSDPSVTAARIANIRNATSNDNIYESVEMIHYKKTVQNLNRIKKTRSVQKTGHSLFDALRVEQALKAPAVRKAPTLRRGEEPYRTQEYSDGNSPNSSSSSGDEYETYPRMYHRQVSKNQVEQMRKQDKQKSKRTEPTGSESDEDWRMIPRPKFFGGKMQPRRIEMHAPAEGPSSTDESDSSINSAILLR